MIKEVRKQEDKISIREIIPIVLANIFIFWSIKKSA